MGDGYDNFLMAAEVRRTVGIMVDFALFADKLPRKGAGSRAFTLLSGHGWAGEDGGKYKGVKFRLYQDAHGVRRCLRIWSRSRLTAVTIGATESG